MNISIKSRLSMEYGWDDSLINKMIKLYGEDYLSERESFYDSLEDKLEDHQITPIKGFTIYSINKKVTVARVHGDALESFSESVVTLFSNMKVISYSSGLDTSSRMNLIADVLELEVIANLGRIWHKQLFSILKTFPKIYSLATPKAMRGETLVVGKRKGSSISVLVDIYKRSMWKNDPVNMDINGVREAVDYLISKQ